MKFLPQRQPPPLTPAREGRFANWLLRQFSAGQAMAGLPYSEVERLCANAGSLLVGAAFARPEAFAADELPGEVAREAALLSRRTADGFKASLADRKNAVIAWPWDHIATKVAWEASRASDTSEDSLAPAIQELATAYALRHREQLTAVLDLWRQVAGNVPAASAAKPDLARMGAEMLDAYEAVQAAALTHPSPAAEGKSPGRG